MHGLESARGFIQAKLADRLQTKYTPVLKFVLDPGVKLSAITAQLLKETEAASTSEAVVDDRDEDELTDDDNAMTAAEEEAGAQDGP
jgi:ribosome-binding factor A